QQPEPLTIGRHRTDTRDGSLRLERLPVKTLAAEVQSDVQHCRGLPSSRRGRTEHDSAGGPPSSHSVAPIVTTIGAPFVLASRAPIAPAQRAPFRQTLLSRSRSRRSRRPLRPS